MLSYSLTQAWEVVFSVLCGPDQLELTLKHTTANMPIKVVSKTSFWLSSVLFWPAIVILNSAKLTEFISFIGTEESHL